MRCQLAVTLLCVALVSITYIQGVGSSLVSSESSSLRGDAHLDSSSHLLREKRQTAGINDDEDDCLCDGNEDEPKSTHNLCLDDCHCNNTRRGAKGPRGEKGCSGRRGYSVVGEPGVEGLPGPKGRPGERGDKGSQGPKGVEGLRGRRGDQGERGDTGKVGGEGDRGFPGDPGVNGGKGDKGCRGLSGMPGNDGMHGSHGCDGEKGEKGDRGPEGPVGDPGCRGKGGKSQTCDGTIRCRCKMPSSRPPIIEKAAFVIAKHSQTTEIPDCPEGSRKLWHGYSLLYTEGEQVASLQDLGSSGSCLKTFDPLPLKFKCQTRNCTFEQREGTSFWLSVNKTVAQTQRIPSEDNVRYISRCSVCQMTSNVLAVHSQNTTVPNCPYGWRSIWNGYSFLMASVGGLGGGQQLTSPGSCLQERERLYIECNGHELCHYYHNKYSYWLVDADKTRPYARQINSYADAMTGRCNVCQYFPPNADDSPASPRCFCSGKALK